MHNMTLYIDESGSAKPNVTDPFPYFAMGGVIIRDADKESVKQAVRKLHADHNLLAPLHSTDIRTFSAGYSWMGADKPRAEVFLSALETMLLSLPLVVHGCVINRAGYIARYKPAYNDRLWEMRKTAMSILIERAAKYAHGQGAKLSVVFEMAGKSEDNVVKTAFRDMKAQGHPFDGERASCYAPLAAGKLSEILSTIEGKEKAYPLLQLADICLYPITIAREKPDYRPYVKLREHGLLIDSHLTPEALATEGIKYFRFDELVAA